MSDSAGLVPRCAVRRGLRVCALIAVLVILSVAESGFGVRGVLGRVAWSLDEGLGEFRYSVLASDRPESAIVLILYPSNPSRRKTGRYLMLFALFMFMLLVACP